MTGDAPCFALLLWQEESDWKAERDDKLQPDSEGERACAHPLFHFLFFSFLTML
jgi:hypothetical protein